VISDDDRWNHNIHYHPVIHRALSDRCQSALDIGCGEGVLTRQLRRHVPQVVGIDVDEPSIRLAERQRASGDVQYLIGDFLTFPFELASFDAVTSVATLHHVDASAGLQRMADLLAPGGTLAVLGLARNRLPRDLHREVIALGAHRFHSLRHDYWEHTAPTVWPPPLTFTQMRAVVAKLLPGADFRRHALWRYSIVWTKPL
jgi:SAM-dependent methyltransferase